MPPRRGQLAPSKPPGPAPAIPQQQQQPKISPAADQKFETRSQTSSGTTNLPVGSIDQPGLVTPRQPTTTTITTTTASSASSTSFPSAPPIPASFSRRKQTILAQLALPDEEYTDLSPKGTVDAGIRDLIDEINAVDGLVTTSSCAGRVSVFLEGRRGGGRGSREIGDDGGGGIVAGGRGAMEEEEGQLQLPGHPQADLVEEEDGFGGGGESARTMTTIAGVGGKGGGGRWLFVSHEPVQMEGKLDSEPNIVGALLGMEEPIFDGRDGRQAEGMGDGSTRLIHFKFEPMVRLLPSHTLSLQRSEEGLLRLLCEMVCRTMARRGFTFQMAIDIVC